MNPDIDFMELAEYLLYTRQKLDSDSPEASFVDSTTVQIIAVVCNALAEYHARLFDDKKPERIDAMWEDK